MPIPYIQGGKAGEQDINFQAGQIIPSLRWVQRFVNEFDATAPNGDMPVKGFVEVCDVHAELMCPVLEGADDTMWDAIHAKFMDIGLYHGQRTQMVSDLQAMSAALRTFQTYARTNVIPADTTYADARYDRVQHRRVLNEHQVRKTVAHAAAVAAMAATLSKG